MNRPWTETAGRIALKIGEEPAESKGEHKVGEPDVEVPLLIPRHDGLFEYHTKDGRGDREQRNWEGIGNDETQRESEEVG